MSQLKPRLFVGNLRGDVVTEETMKEIFSQYGNVVEVKILPKFGFVEYENMDGVEKAIAEGNGQSIEGKEVTLELAGSKSKNDRGAKQGGRSNDSQNGRGRNRRERSPRRRDSQRRDWSPPRDSRNDGRGEPDRYHERRISRPADGSVVKVLLLGASQRQYARSVCREIDRYGIPLRIEMLDGRSLAQAIDDAVFNNSRYVLIVGRNSQRDGLVTYKDILDKGSTAPSYELDPQEVAMRVVESERALGFNVTLAENLPRSRDGFSNNHFDDEDEHTAPPRNDAPPPFHSNMSRQDSSASNTGGQSSLSGIVPAVRVNLSHDQISDLKNLLQKVPK